MAAPRSLLRRLSALGRYSPIPPFPLLPSDVCPDTGLCAGGLVKIACSPGKGHGAFAARHIEASHEIGRYCGELLYYERDKEARYGFKRGLVRDDDVAWQDSWSRERQARGVSVSGAYVFGVGRCPESGRQVFLDAEDPAHANWTRFINHEAHEPNLTAVVEFVPQSTPQEPAEADAPEPSTAVAWGVGLLASLGVQPAAGNIIQPLVRFVVARPIQPGEELHFNYGTGWSMGM